MFEKSLFAIFNLLLRLLFTRNSIGKKKEIIESAKYILHKTITCYVFTFASHSDFETRPAWLSYGFARRRAFVPSTWDFPLFLGLEIDPSPLAASRFDLGKRSAILLTFVKLAATTTTATATTPLVLGCYRVSPVGMRLGLLSVIQRLLKSGC